MHFPMKIHILNEQKILGSVADAQSCGYLVHKIKESLVFYIDGLRGQCSLKMFLLLNPGGDGTT